MPPSRMECLTLVIAALQPEGPATFSPGLTPSYLCPLDRGLCPSCSGWDTRVFPRELVRNVSDMHTERSAVVRCQRDYDRGGWSDPHPASTSQRAWTDGTMNAGTFQGPYCLTKTTVTFLCEK